MQIGTLVYGCSPLQENIVKEFLLLLFSFNLHGLFVKPTYNTVIQVFRALFVGGLSFIADAGVLWTISLTGIHYLVCTVFGFFVGVAVNYILSVKFVFKEKASVPRYGEIAIYIVVGAVGLALTIGFMWFFTEVIGLYFMISRAISVVLVFAWNFLSRKYTIYRKAT